MKRHTILLLIASLASVSLAGAASDRGMSQEAVYRLANQIRKQILILPNYGVFDSLSFSMSEGTAGVRVRLTGYASRPTLKSSAEAVVKKLEAVESVDNQIEVRPTSRRDEDIRLGVYARIYGYSALGRYDPSRRVPMYGVRSEPLTSFLE